MGLYGDTVCLVTHTGQNLVKLVTEASSGLSDGFIPSWPDGWKELPDRGFWVLKSARKGQISFT